VTALGTPARLLRPVAEDAVAAGLADALAGGAPIAPLSDASTERRLTLEMLRPEVPVTEPDAAAVVATSGSTGRPKGVVLSRSAITAAATATHHRLGGAGDWVLALPAHYVAGLMVLARCLVAGTTATRVATDLTGLTTATGRLGGRRYLSLVPTQLARACADQELAETLATFDAVLLGGAAADPALLERARALGIPVVTSYGMSETCGGCVYDGVPLDDVSVDLQPATGRITLSGPCLFSGYRLRPDLTAAALQGGRLLTQDRGQWEQDRLRVVGRLDDVVVSGGINVDLAAVERAARGWPALAGAELVVVGVPDQEWGTEVVAVTDGAGSGAGSVEDLRSHLRPTLPAAAAPRRLVRVDKLPRTSSGKVDRQRLVADLGADPIRSPR
jgi:O-succinylbenzoic acid--CoA ligase